MKDNELKFRNNKDQTPVVDIDGKKAKKLSGIYDKLNLNLGFCYEQLQKGALKVGMMETHLSLTEHLVMDFLKEMGYEGVLKKEMDERHARIREVNMQNRALREQLGQKVTNEDFRERAKNISNSIRAWWDIYGFGHTSDVFFTENGYAKVTFSGMIFGAHYDNDDKTEEQKLAYLKSLGFECFESEKHVKATDKNLALVTNLIKEKYPSAVVTKVNTWNARRKEMCFDDIEVYIYDLNDIQ